MMFPVVQGFSPPSPAFFAGGAICHVCHGSFYKVHRVYYRGRWLRAMETRTKWAMASMAM